jgi:Common central domain of tyrosinase/Polyphenol oxidase middle domain
MKNHFTRRRFLKAASLAASAVILEPSPLKGNAIPAGTVVRRDIGGLTANHPIIVSYRKAIKAMKALRCENPLSWAYQAAIHQTTLPHNLPCWNKCEHDGSLFFWSWHRMYLYWFERIIRKMSGDPGWALPYWNWTSPTQLRLPAMFRDDPTSELYVADRNPAMNNGTGSLDPLLVDYSIAFREIDYRTASTMFQDGPHGAVHNGVGGGMQHNVTTALDPIFFLHHSNVDRLWNLWLAQGGRNNPMDDVWWKGYKFCFYDENGALVRMTSCNVLRAAEQLHYTYEGEPPQVKQNCLDTAMLRLTYKRESIARLPIRPLVLGGQPVSVDIAVNSFKQQLATLAANKKAKLFLELDGVEAARQPGVVWEVYVGASPHQFRRDLKNPYHIGNIVLFATGIRNEAHHGYKPAHFIFAINQALQAALKLKRDRIPLTFVPHGILINGKPSRPNVESPLRIGQINISVEIER